MRKPNPLEVSATVYDLAAEIAKLLKRGQCVPTPAMQARFDTSRENIRLALTYLQERGLGTVYSVRDRCWTLTLQDVNWRKLRLGELDDLGLLPEDEQLLLELALRSSPSNDQTPNPGSENVRDLITRLSF